MVEGYDGIAMEFTLDNTIETSFISGTKYRFRLSATNSIGEGEMSNSATVALADAAPQPAAPTLVLEKSTKTSLYIEWLAVTPTDSLVIDGYKLFKIKLGTGESTTVYDGSENSERLFYNVTGLETGQRYTFSVVSINFNGVSEPSDELVAVVC